MKEGRVSSSDRGPMFTSGRSARVELGSLGLSVGSSLYRTVVSVMSWVGAAPVAQFGSGPSGGQGRRGACRSKGLVAGQHVPDRLGEAACDLDRGDLGSALLPVAVLHPVADGAVGRVPADRGVGRFD